LTAMILSQTFEHYLQAPREKQSELRLEIF
jgi:hypothetical protein